MGFRGDDPARTSAMVVIHSTHVACPPNPSATSHPTNHPTHPPNPCALSQLAPRSLEKIEIPLYRIQQFEGNFSTGSDSLPDDNFDKCVTSITFPSPFGRSE